MSDADLLSVYVLYYRAREVKIQNSILAVPEQKSGRTLSITVTDAVHDFFENDEHTRLIPGRKDFVSIKEAEK